MYEMIQLRFYQFLEALKSGKVIDNLKQVFFCTEEVVPVKKSLSTLKTKSPQVANSHLNFDVLNSRSSLNDHVFALKSREARAKIYLKKGYGGFALLNGKEVIGELWFSPGPSDETGNVHPMAGVLGLTIGSDEAYMFDMFVSSSARGKSITTDFLNRALTEMKARGYQNVYGFFDTKNMPALWIHRVFGYEELPHRLIKKRFLKESVCLLEKRSPKSNSVTHSITDSHGLLDRTNSDTIGR